MILVDANLLVYACAPSLPQHEAARAWLDGRLSGTALVGLPWPSLIAYIRIVTNPRIFERPATIPEAGGQVEEGLAREVVWTPRPTDRHAEVLGRLLREGTDRSDLVPDAHLAALATEHGLTLNSTDGDFARFPGLRWENPLRPRA